MDNNIAEIFRRCEEFIDSSTPAELIAYEKSLNINYEDYIIKGEKMTKGILVMDQPECCYECPCYVPSCDIDFDFDEDICGATQNVTYGNASPDWCPVKPAPQKIHHKSRQALAQEQFAAGWNACVDEILGE